MMQHLNYFSLKIFKVITLLIISGLFYCNIIYATPYYVNKNAAGLNNGTSWTNAWTSFSAINWSSIQPGDKVYISGGTDSLQYNEILTVGANGTAGNPITIIAGKYSPSPGGHSGRVIIDGGGTRTQSIQIRANSPGRKYITIKGFELRRATMGVNIEDYASNIILDSLNIYDYQGQAGIMLNGASTYTIDNTIIRNCRIVSYQLYNGQTDGIYAQRCQKTFVYNNYVRQRNQDPSAHTDALQAYLTNGWVIYNNFFINDSVYSPEGGGTPMILGSEGTNPVIIYNNFIYMGGIWDPSGSQNSALWTRWYDNNPMPPTWVIHNTIVVNGPRCRNFIQEYDAVTINNILAVFSTSGGMANLEENLPTAIPVDNTRHNLFWRSWADVSFAGSFTGNGHTGSVSGWTNWTSYYGGTGAKGNPLFVKHIGYEPNQGALNGELQPGSPAINQGEDAQVLINWLNTTYSLNLPWTDIKGNPRDNTPTIGANEYTTGGGGNNPPNQPSNPNPVNGATGRPVNLTMTWTCTDPDGNPLTYDVYFGTNSNPPVVSTNQSAANFNPGQLNNNTTYYWKIVAKDNQGATTSGPVWNFTTQTVVVNNPPNQPSNPNPVNGATGRPVNLTMTWTCTDPDGNPLTYDVYFGTNSNPPVVSTNQSVASFNPGQLVNSTIYYWKIVAKDNQGATTSGPIWNFTTQTAVVNNPPNQPSNPNPVNGAIGRPVNLTMTWTCTDPDGDPLTYDVYFGTNSNPPIASTNRTSASFTPAQLNNNTTYYWKIVAKDNQGHSTSGTVWNFTTETGGGGDTLVMFPVQNVEGIIIEPDHTPEKTIDGLGALSGDPDSRWAAEPMPEELTFDLGSIRTVCKTKLSFYNWNAGRVYNYSVSISSDNNNWVTIVPQATSASNEEWAIHEFPAVDARYVRVHFINNNQSTWAGLWEGEIWGTDNIVTINNPPNQPSNPNPVNGAIGRPVNLTMTWTCTDPDGDPLTYDVYFGTNSNPPIASTNRTSASFTPAQLNNNTTYYWKIVAKDNQGHSTSGPVWNFTTIYMDIIPPEVINITVTSAKNVTVNFSEKLNPTNASNKNNYLISNNVTINSVSLLPDSSSVLIITSIQQRNREYSITMTNIADKSGNYTDPNPNVVSYFLPRRGPGYMIIIPVNKVIANNFDPNFLPEKTVDGKGMESPDSRWQSSTIMPDTLIFDFGNESSLDSLRISFYEWQSNRIYKYSVNCSVDSMKWHSIIKNVWSEEDEWTEIEFDSTSARYVELILQESNENTMASIWEIEFYGPDRMAKITNETETPNSFMLSQNYPNPFNPSTTFKYSIAKQSSVLIKIYDLIGNEIETLVNEEKPVGTYELTWNASNLPSGVYFYQLQAGDFKETKKMILMK